VYNNIVINMTEIRNKILSILAIIIFSSSLVHFSYWIANSIVNNFKLKQLTVYGVLHGEYTVDPLISITIVLNVSFIIIVYYGLKNLFEY